jgi:NADPH:quinone reductase-like Zn-dependent oxidoreductase
MKVFKMKAIKIKQQDGTDGIYLDAVEDAPQPEYGEIRVKIYAGSLNFHDYLVAAGQLPTADGRVLLSDGAGVVEAVGPGVSEFNVGDNVVSTFFPQWREGAVPSSAGGFSQTPGDGVDGFAIEYITRSESAFTHAPKGWSHAEAATITTAGLTAWRALVADCGIKAGDKVLTLGTGGVSLAAIQIAKMHGAEVFITSSSDEKLMKAKELGADHVINYAKNPNWSEKVLELTQGNGVDHVIELGGPGTLEQSTAAVKVGGNISLIGVLTGFEGVFPTAQLMFKQVKLQGLLVGSRQQQADYIKALEGSTIRPVVDRVFKYENLKEAFEYQLSGAHFGKICVEW